MNSKKTCRFCMKTIYGNEYDIVENIIKHMLDALLLKLNVDDGEETVMCHECTTKLKNAVDFKTVCLNTENIILPLNRPIECVTVEEGKLKENMIVEAIGVYKGHKVCRFCTKITENGGYICLQDKKEYMFLLDMVQKYIPELQIYLTEELVSCDTCLESLQDLSRLITNYLESEERIKKHGANCSDFNICKMEIQYDENEQGSTVKNEVEDEEIMNLDFVELDIKNEEIENELGQMDCERYQVLLETFKCQMCSFQTNCERDYEQHCLTHQESTEVTYSKKSLYKCKSCSYETKYKSSLKKHLVIHEDSPEVFKCENCPFETRHKGSLKRHCLSHQEFRPDNSSAVVYKCEECSYESKSKNNLQKHSFTHKDISKVTMFKCEICLYASKRKSNVIKHLLIHKNPSEATVYNCEKCSFKTIHKMSLKSHCMTHRDISEIPIYKCDLCSFKTKHKTNLKRHCMTHEDFSYKCESCQYSTFRKDLLKKHMMRVHKLSATIV